MSRALANRSSTITYVSGADLEIWRPAGAVFLRATIRDDRSVIQSVIKRAFPLSQQMSFLSIQDAGGNEVCILRSLDGLSESSLKCVQEEFDRRYYTPRIDRIANLIQDAGMWRFDVETQRGNRRFFVRNWRDSAYEISPGRWHIQSVDGARYEIPDLNRLDESSLRFMDLLL